MMPRHVVLALAIMLTSPSPVPAIEILELEAGSIVMNLGHPSFAS
jgi:hypothetical protein